MGGEVTRAGTKLAKKQPETANGETNAHQTQPGTNPGEKGSFCSEVNPGVLFCRLLHGGNCICRGVKNALSGPITPGEQIMDAITQLCGIERRPDLHVIVEIDKDIATRAF